MIPETNLYVSFLEILQIWQNISISNNPISCFEQGRRCHLHPHMSYIFVTDTLCVTKRSFQFFWKSIGRPTEADDP